MRITLPPDVVRAIEKYVTTDWKDGLRDPSKIGALNVVAYIGERIAAVYMARKNRRRQQK